MLKRNTIKATAAAIMGRWFHVSPGPFAMQIDGSRAPELAAWLGLDEDLTYRAVALLVRQGELDDRGELGIFRVAQRALPFPDPKREARAMRRRARDAARKLETLAKEMPQ